ncbi:GHMP family kinase ATP-binding protein [Micromonospora tarensis]|uniref:Kinase n=1 Tax=Micromonospora tarensis TaxID=2806100 RepID=A0ABS1YBH5_9ACTN|nr:kinase [Micromonospora tarensis]MBM0274707.1 kinase [Micromonospora tarensis]
MSQVLGASQAASELAGEVGTGHAFGTFGELLQGVLPGGGTNFLVTFPIDAWATATFRYHAEARDITLRPAHKRKCRAVAGLVLAAAGVAGGGELELTGDLPEGKGLASSSADLVATVRAVGAAIGMRLTAARIESFLRHIEPSDGVMYDEIVAYYQRQVRLCRPIGRLPALTIVAHDEGGQVDTIRHSRLPNPFSTADAREYARLLDELTEAITVGDLPTVGRISTRSAVLNSKARIRHDLDALRRACHDVGGLGLVLAHSGTMLGVVLEADDPELTGKVQHLRAAGRPLGGQVSVYHSLGAGRDWSPQSGTP